MPYSDPKKQKLAQAKHYQKYKKKYRGRDKERLEEARQFVRQYKEREDIKCDCGEGRWQCLDFHHTDRTQKIKTISQMVRSRYSIERIVEEIKKCKVMCANCHRVHHNGCNWEESFLSVH